MTPGMWREDRFVLEAEPEHRRPVVISFRTYGRLNSAKDNAILLPTFFSGQHDDYGAWIGSDLPFDPSRWFVVAVDMFGNGLSSSPTTVSARIPTGLVSIADNVRAQRLMLQGRFGIESLAMVAGWSMGGMQAFEWAARYPSMVRSILPICATAQCWPLNRAFLQGLDPFLEMEPRGRQDALRAFGRAYSSWAYSAEFYREGLFEVLGRQSAEELAAWWADDHVRWDPRDLLTMSAAWQRADFVSNGLSAPERLASISAEAVVMPSSSDMYFTLEEAALETALLPHARLEPITSAFGHAAGRPGLLPEVTAQIGRASRELLERIA